jgi:G3E family GTPase
VVTEDRSAIPMLVLTGFHGAGKSTLLARWLADPAFASTAACVNCVEDLPRPGIERAILETTDLAEPLPIVAELAANRRAGYRLHGVVTAVDALEGARSLAEQCDSRAQAALADALVLTKTDLASRDEVDRLADRLMALNPDAEIIRSALGNVDACGVWNAVAASPGRDLRQVRALVESGNEAREIRAITLRYPRAVELSGFCVRLASFLEKYAGRVLRVKGRLKVEGRHGPESIQAVGSRVYPVRTLKEWPEDDRESALVVVSQGLDEKEIRAALGP